MAITDVLYDLVSGTAGAVMGALVMTLLNLRKNKKLRLENKKLLDVIKDKENQILVLEQKIVKQRVIKKAKK